MGSLVFQATLGGQVNLNGPNTASTFDIAVPATTGTMVTTGDSGTVTNTMLAGSIANAKLTNSSVTVGSTSIALGATSTTLDGVNIGATTAGTGAFTTLSASSTVSGTGFSTYLASPPAIGGTTAAAGAFTTLSASSTVSGTGFSTYLASPPAIGGTAAAAGTFTTLSGTTSVTTPIVKSASSLTFQTNGTTTAVTVDTSQNVGIGTTSPAAKLDISGSSNLIGVTNTSGSGYGTINMQVGTQQARILLSGQSFSDANYGTGDLTIQALTSGKGIRFGTSGNTNQMFIDSSGNVGIGTTSPSSRFHTYKASGENKLIVENGAASQSATLSLITQAATPGGCYIYMGKSGATTNGQILYDPNSDFMATYTNNAERMRIESSGRVLIAATATSAYFDANFNVNQSSASGVTMSTKQSSGTASQVSVVNWHTATTGDNQFIQFGTEASFTQRGSIVYNRAGGLTVYNTTSDYRAKTVNGLVENALAKVALLKPSTGRMNGASIDIEFFVAHELQEVIPSAVTGKKDAVNEDGSPAYQMVDKSAIIPLLTAAIQELTARVAALEAK